jgi:hypothetical protein
MPKSSWRLHAALWFAVLAMTACVYDSAQRCGSAMTFVEASNSCVCNPGAVAVAGGCQLCASDEVAADGKCACAAGKTKSAEDVCVTVAGLGDPCDASGAPCTDATYSYCAMRSGAAEGVCTKRCAANADCDAAYTCATWDAEPACRTFEGVGNACASPADCTGDANFCDTIQTHSCGIAGCSLTDNNCPRGSTCCDFSAYGLGTLCAGACL